MSLEEEKCFTTVFLLGFHSISLHRDSLSSRFNSLEALKKDRWCLSLLMFQSLAYFCMFGLFDCLFVFLCVKP